MHKRILIILAIITLSTALLIGCGNKQEEPAQPETTTAESTTEQTEEATATPEETTTPKETEEPASETTEEPAQTEATTTETVEVSEETTTPKETEEPTPEPEPQVTYTYTDMSATMYATQTVNVRDLPSTDGGKIGSLSTNQEITVLGQCNETSWYTFDYNGQTAFVSNKYLSTEKVEVQQAPPAQETAQAPSNVPNPYELATQTWIDLGDWFLYIQPSLDDPESNFDSPFWQNQRAILQERNPDRHITNGCGINLDNGTWSAWMIAVGGTNSYDYPQALLDFIAKYQYHY